MNFGDIKCTVDYAKSFFLQGNLEVARPNLIIKIIFGDFDSIQFIMMFQIFSINRYRDRYINKECNIRDGIVNCNLVYMHNRFDRDASAVARSEEHTSELQSRRYLHSFPTRRSSDLQRPVYQ